MKMNDDLFISNIGLVKTIVNRLNYGYVDKDDLYQAGLIGLYKATQKVNNLNSFKSYASIYIINEIKEEFRNSKLIIVSKDVMKVKKYFKQNNYQNKTIKEIANILNVSVDTVYTSLNYLNDIKSLNEVVEEDELINYIKSDYMFNKYDYYVNKLDYLSKEVIILKYYKNYTQKEIAKILNCSQSKISRIEKIALDIIKKNMK